VKEVQPLYQKLNSKSPKEAVEIAANERSNSLIILSTESNFKRLSEFVASLDTDEAMEKVTRTFMLKNADAQDVTKQLTSINQDSDSSSRYRYFYYGGESPKAAKKPSFVADRRRNAVVVQAPPAQMDSIVKMIEELDEPVGEDSLAPRIYQLKFVSAVDIEDVLNELFLKKQERRPYYFYDDFDSDSNQTADRDVGRLYGKVRITSEPYSNTLIITSNSKENLQAVEDILKQLDIPSQAGETTVRVALRFAKSGVLANSLNILFAKNGSPPLRPQQCPSSSPPNPPSKPQPPREPRPLPKLLRTQPRILPGRLLPLARWPTRQPPHRRRTHLHPPGQRPRRPRPRRRRPARQRPPRLRQRPSPPPNPQTRRGHGRPHRPGPHRRPHPRRSAPTNSTNSASAGPPTAARSSAPTTTTVPSSPPPAVATPPGSAAKPKSTPPPANSPPPSPPFARRPQHHHQPRRPRPVPPQEHRRRHPRPAPDQRRRQRTRPPLRRQQVPFIDKSQTTDQGGLNQSFQYKLVGIILEVTPRINKAGDISLRIRAESSAINQGQLVLGGAVVDTRNFRTDVTAKDGEILVLGGIIQKQMSDTLRKNALLGDIPGLGWAFKKKDKSVRNVELMVFLRPKITRTPEQARKLLQDLDKEAPLIAPWKYGGMPSPDSEKKEKEKEKENEKEKEKGKPVPAPPEEPAARVDGPPPGP
jgi:hypothetical protein